MKEYKEYDKKNKVINEIKEGKGLIKDYDPEGILLFQCEYSNGERNGKVEIYYDNGLMV